MPEPQKLDVVFVVCTSSPGNSSSKINTIISRVFQHLTTLKKDCRIAWIRFKQEYNSGAGVNLFCNYVSDFSNVYCDAKANEGNPLQYGYPLQHVANLSFRHDATKICFLVSNVLPFNDSCEETVIYKNEINITSTNNENKQQDSNTSYCASSQNNTENNTNQQTEDEANTRVPTRQSTCNIVFHEDPLQSCRIMAAMGIILYTIETIPNSMIYKDMYDALCYITGGQYLNVHQSELGKAIKAAILEEVSLEHLVGYVKDYLCVAWLAWGRMKTNKPSNLQQLTENVLNYLHKVNITKREILIDNKPLTPPSRHAKMLTTLMNVAEARRIKDTQDNWAAEISWVMPETCNEVIPGYDTPATGKPQKANMKKVTISAYQRPTQNQVQRVVVRTLGRRTGLIRKHEQPAQVRVERISSNMDDLRTENTHNINSATVVKAVQKDHEVEKSKENVQRTKDDQEATCNPQQENKCEIHSEEKLVLSCTQELIAEKLTEKCTIVTCKNCVLV